MLWGRNDPSEVMVVDGEAEGAYGRLGGAGAASGEPHPTVT